MAAAGKGMVQVVRCEIGRGGGKRRVKIRRKESGFSEGGSRRYTQIQGESGRVE